MKNELFKINWGSINVIDKLFSSKLLIMIMFIPFFKADSFDFIPYLSTISNLLLVAESILFFTICILSKNKSKFYILLCIYCLWAFFVAPLIKSNTPPSNFYLFSILGIVSFFNVGFRTNLKKFLDAICSTFTIMIILNYITLLIYPNGLTFSAEGAGIFLFGLRTSFSLVIIPGILFNLLYDNYIKKRTYSARTVFCLIFSILALLNKWVVTGLLELIIVIALYLYLYLYKFNMKKKLNVAILLFILFFNFFMTFFNSSIGFVQDVANVMHKDITFSGRTYIWKTSVNKLNQSPIFGYGSNIFVDIYGTLKPAHNHWLNIGLESGYVGLIIMLTAYVISIIQLKSLVNKDYYNLIFIVCLSILVGCISEIQSYFSFIYVIFELPFLLKLVDSSEVQLDD